MYAHYQLRYLITKVDTEGSCTNLNSRKKVSAIQMSGRYPYNWFQVSQLTDALMYLTIWYLKKPCIGWWCQQGQQGQDQQFTSRNVAQPGGRETYRVQKPITNGWRCARAETRVRRCTAMIVDDLDLQCGALYDVCNDVHCRKVQIYNDVHCTQMKISVARRS